MLPGFFFLNGELHKYIKVVKSDNSVVAWNYRQESRLWIPRGLVRSHHKKAFTYGQAAKVMNVKKATLTELVDRGMVKAPSKSYDLSDYRPLVSYFSEEDMLDLRQAAWDTLPKNRFGEPYKDTMASEPELIHRMKVLDDREFRYDEDTGLELIYKAQ